jgi:prepilin-type processing-associated H-X9-DG protein
VGEKMELYFSFSHKNGSNTLFFDRFIISQKSLNAKKYSHSKNENLSNQVVLENGSLIFTFLSLLKF